MVDEKIHDKKKTSLYPYINCRLQNGEHPQTSTISASPHRLRMSVIPDRKAQFFVVVVVSLS